MEISKQKLVQFDNFHREDIETKTVKFDNFQHEDNETTGTVYIILNYNELYDVMSFMVCHNTICNTI